MGASTGGLDALSRIFAGLRHQFPLPIVVVQHTHPSTDMEFMVQYLNGISSLPVKEAQDKELIIDGMVYLAPPDYHLLVNRDGSFGLNVDAKVNFSRPSIDMLFESAADAFGPELIGIILTGANSDGADGLVAIKVNGGLTIAQDPQEAEIDIMPCAAINRGCIDQVLCLHDITELLNTLEG